MGRARHSFHAIAPPALGTYATYFVNLKKYAYSYKFTKTISATGSFQVKAYEGTGASKGWVSFKVK